MMFERCLKVGQSPFLYAHFWHIYFIGVFYLWRWKYKGFLCLFLWHIRLHYSNLANGIVLDVFRE